MEEKSGAKRLKFHYMDKKNTIIGSLLLCAAFYFMFVSSTNEARTEQSRREAASAQAVEQQAKAAKPAQQAAATSPFASEESAKEEIVSLKNGNIAVYFTNRGGAIASVQLLKYANTQGNSAPYAFNAIKDALPALSLAFYDDTSFLPQPLLSKFSLTASTKNSLTYEYAVPGKIKIVRKYALTDAASPECAPYTVLVGTSIENISNAPMSLREVYLCLGSVPPTASDIYGSNLAAAFFDGDRNTHFSNSSAFVDSSGFLGIGASKSRPFEKVSAYPVKWAAVKNQFFAAIFTPEKLDSNGGIAFPLAMDSASENKYMRNAIAGFMGFEMKTLKPKQSWEISGTYYVGPKELDRIYSLGGGQEDVMNYGWAGFISRPLSRLMNWIYSIVSTVSPDWGWGWSIIILTLIVRGLLWPLTSVQIKSAQRMAKMQEPLKVIREKHKGDNKKIQQETMKLYSEYGINPLAGCLPVLIQIPIFIGLYYMLQTSCEIRFAHFLWIKDLSLPDTIEALPSIFGIPLHILPLLNALVTFIQMHLTPMPSTDKAQAMMFKFMPVIMLLFFYTFPSGLVLYWLVQSLLGILQAIIIRRGKDKVVLKKRTKPGFMQRMQQAMENAQAVQENRGEEFKKLPLSERLRIAKEDAQKARQKQKEDKLKGTLYENRKKNPGGRSTPPKR